MFHFHVRKVENVTNILGPELRLWVNEYRSLGVGEKLNDPLSCTYKEIKLQYDNIP